MVMPMSPESAISDVMTQAVPRISAEWELDVWCPTEPAYRPCPVPVVPYETPSPNVRRALATYDLVIYVLGNSPWHSRILPLTQSLPGLVVLHDVSLTDLVRHTAIENGTLDLLAQQLEPEIGHERTALFTSAFPADQAQAWLELCAEVPLDGFAIRRSLGVVVHSQWHAGLVDGLTLGDVTVAPLPVPSTRMGFDSNQEDDASDLLLDLPQDALLLVTVGAVNANRRIDLLLQAIADDAVLASRVHLWAVGPTDGHTSVELSHLAAALGLSARFAMTGRVTDRLLQAILARADFSAGLRDPVLEGQSASVLTQFLAGLPVVVFDHAHYADLPDDVALKVDPANGQVAIRDALRLLVDDPDERLRRGEAGRDYVLRSRSGTAYAEALLEAGARAMSVKPMVDMTEELAARLGRLDLARQPAVVDAVTRFAFELYDLE